METCYGFTYITRRFLNSKKRYTIVLENILLTQKNVWETLVSRRSKLTTTDLLVDCRKYTVSNVAGLSRQKDSQRESVLVSPPQTPSFFVTNPPLEKYTHHSFNSVWVSNVSCSVFSVWGKRDPKVEKTLIKESKIRKIKDQGYVFSSLFLFFFFLTPKYFFVCQLIVRHVKKFCHLLYPRFFLFDYNLVL